MNKSVLLAYLICLAPGAAAAAANAPPLQMTTEKTAFEQQIAAVRAGIQPRGRYEFVTAEERDRVSQALTDIDSLLNKHDALSELSRDEKTTILSAVEQANAILVQRDGERLICENSAPIGSHQKRTRCQTYAEQQRQAQHDQNYIGTVQRTPNTSGGGK